MNPEIEKLEYFAQRGFVVNINFFPPTREWKVEIFYPVRFDEPEKEHMRQLGGTASEPDLEDAICLAIIKFGQNHEFWAKEQEFRNQLISMGYIEA